MPAECRQAKKQRRQSGGGDRSAREAPYRCCEDDDTQQAKAKRYEVAHGVGGSGEADIPRGIDPQRPRDQMRDRIGDEAVKGVQIQDTRRGRGVIRSTVMEQRKFGAQSKQLDAIVPGNAGLEGGDDRDHHRRRRQ